MDGLSAAASIWSLVQATGALIKYFNAAKSAPKDMSNIQRELSILNSLLITLINLKFHFENSETSREWNSVIRTLGVEHGPFAECADTMAQLNEKVSSKKGFRAIATWAFIKDDVHEMLDKIARLKTTINLILSADQLKLSNLMFTQVKELGSKLNNDQGREMVREALNWISSLNFRTQQARHKSLMDQHTGDWFLHSQEFGSWLEQPSQTLFCPGIPGAGKTMMAATVVNYIENNVLNASASTNLAYIFCDYKSEEEQSVDQLLGCLLQQLIQSNHELAGPLIALHEAHAERKSFPSADEIAGILQAVISKHTDVYIVVDAIDECPQKNRKRRRLLSALQNLQVKTDVLHLLVTSRLSPDVAEAFKDAPTIEVEAHTDDVRRYVRGRFEDFKARLNDDWQAKVEAAVINSTRGMFLLARFLVDRFASLHTIKHVKALVSELGQSSTATKTTVDVYHDMYRATMKRIDDQAERDSELATRALMWVSNAARLLNAQELCSALSLEPDDTEFDTDNLLDIELIVSVCAGLVIVEEESEIIRLVHYTAQEYFDGLGHDRRAKEQQVLAVTCLTYLCFDNFKLAPLPQSDSVTEGVVELFNMGPGWLRHHPDTRGSNGGGSEERDSVRSGEIKSVQLLGDGDNSHCAVEHAFVDYAANFWALHAQHCQAGVKELTLQLLADQQLAAHAFHKATSLHRRWSFLRSGTDMITTRTTGLHLVAANGLTHICRELLTMIDANPNIHADAKDDGGRTALMWAAHHGHSEIVELLLDRQYDVRHDRTCHRGDTALNYAARQGQVVIIKLLLEADRVIPKSISTNYLFQRDKIFGRKLYMCQHVCRENVFGETASVQAVLEGHDEVVRLLREHDKRSLHREVMFGLWPIHIAAQRRPVSTMRSLIDEWGVDAAIEDPKGYSPFVVAADWNNGDVVRYFIQEKRKLLVQKPQMVLQAAKVTAANWKREAILRLIVEETGLRIGEGHLEALLEVAISAGNVSIAIFLAAQKAERDIAKS